MLQVLTTGLSLELREWKLSFSPPARNSRGGEGQECAVVQCKRRTRLTIGSGMSDCEWMRRRRMECGGE
jgi:hypothetical protein